jgi:hypothetical protein
MGTLGDHPPADHRGFTRFAADLALPDIHQLLQQGTPLDEPVSYRYLTKARSAQAAIPIRVRRIASGSWLPWDVGLWWSRRTGADWNWASSAQSAWEGITMSTVTPAAPATRPARRNLIRAWVSLGLIVPGFVGLMAFGEWAQVEDAPVLASVMTVVMTVVLAAFAAGAVWFGVQANRLGRRVGLVPAILAGLAAAYYLLLWVAYLLGAIPSGG